MRVRPFAPIVAVLLVLGAGACADVRDRVDELGGSADDLTDQARFCLSVTRALTATDAGSPETAAAAAEELLAHAPEHLREDARTVARALIAARDEDAAPLEDPEARAAAERLRDGTRELCDPTS